MSIFTSDIDKMKSLLEGVTTSPKKTVMESVSVSSIKKTISESDSSKKKSFQKKFKAKVKTKMDLKDRIKILNSLYEAMNAEYGLDNQSAQSIAFFESVQCAKKSLEEMYSNASNDLEKFYELYKKFYDTGSLTDEEKKFLKENDPDVNNLTTSTTFTTIGDEKKNNLK